MTAHRIVRIISIALIALLASASVRNIHDRSLEVHTVSGWHIWNIAIGFALFFALVVYAAMVARQQRTKIALAPIVVLAGAVTSAIQTGLYLNHGAGWMTALAFGVGVPLAEGALAVVDALMERDAEGDAPAQRNAGPGMFSKLGNALTDAAVQRIEGAAQSVPTVQATIAPVDAPAVQPDDAPALHGDALDIPARDALEAMHDDALFGALRELQVRYTNAQLGDAWGVNASTAQRWVKRRLEKVETIHANGNGVEVL